MSLFTNSLKVKKSFRKNSVRCICIGLQCEFVHKLFEITGMSCHNSVNNMYRIPV